MELKDERSLAAMATRYVYYTGQHVFITGKAGTGKTTLLRRFKQECTKKMAVVSPTGVAAIHAGGVTIHSFFQLPPGAFIPTMENFWEAESNRFITHQGLLKNIRLTKAKRDILQELELLIVDEVSMLRADMLDAMDAILRWVRGKREVPFGGVQLVYFGDLYQLPPVVKEDEWGILKNYYRTPFFFSAQVIQEAPPLFIELDTIYRQTDRRFIDILNSIRNNEITDDEINFLNRRYDPYFRASPDEPYIILTTHNYKAERVNQQSLQSLESEEFVFEGEITDEFNEKVLPVEKTLRLKKGAQVMFIRNDSGENRRYYNGKIGIVTDISSEHICVTCPGDEEMIELKKDVWNNIRYVYNPDKDILEEEILGTYSQYPIRLAWAITIHKSQGLTFEKAIIDSVDSFSPGQVYVALSRLTSLNGLILSTPVHRDAIKTDERIALLKNHILEPEDEPAFYREQKHRFLRQYISGCFLWQSTLRKVDEHLGQKKLELLQEEPDASDVLRLLHQKGNELQRVGNAFVRQLDQLMDSDDQQTWEKTAERLTAAFTYFSNELRMMLDKIEQLLDSLRKKKRTKKKIKDLEKLKLLYIHQLEKIGRAEKIAVSMVSGEDLARAFHYKIDTTSKNKEKNIPIEPTFRKKEKGATYKITLSLYRQGKTIEEIAKERNLVKSTIESHLAKLVENDELIAEDIIGAEKVKQIVNTAIELQTSQFTPIKEILGDNYSYGEIKIALASKYYRNLLSA
jgi:hypothetical protein